MLAFFVTDRSTLAAPVALGHQSAEPVLTTQHYLRWPVGVRADVETFTPSRLQLAQDLLHL
jgi:hypothetical protein